MSKQTDLINIPDAITVSGSNVGIGNAVASSMNAGANQLVVGSGSAGQGITLYSSTSTAGSIHFADGTSGDATYRGQLVYNHNGDYMAILTAATERMRIDSSGRVGIGVTASARLDVNTTSGTLMRVENPSVAQLNIGNGGASTNFYDANTQIFRNGSGTERMRIDASGNVLINTTVVGQPNANAMVYDHGGMIRLSRANGNTGNYVYFIYNGLGVGSIANNGGSAVSYNTSSDYRLKTDAQPMTGASARVQALNPVNFEWISDGTRVDGFLAHEAQAVVPEAITGTKDAMRDEEYEVTPAVLDDDGNVTTEAVMGTRSVPDYQGIDQSKLVPLLTAALQEALTEIASLKTRVEALET